MIVTPVNEFEPMFHPLFYFYTIYELLGSKLCLSLTLFPPLVLSNLPILQLALTSYIHTFYCSYKYAFQCNLRHNDHETPVD